MSYPTLIVAVLIELIASGLMLGLACRRFRSGEPGKIGYLSALLGGAGGIDCLSHILPLIPQLPALFPSSLARMLTALCLTFFFLLLFQEGAAGSDNRTLTLAADACAGLRMLMCITSANNWTGTAVLPFWTEIRTALLFVLGLLTVSVWFLRRRERSRVWLFAGLTLILCIPPELYGTESGALALMLALSLAAAAATAVRADK